MDNLKRYTSQDLQNYSKLVVDLKSFKELYEDASGVRDWNTLLILREGLENSLEDLASSESFFGSFNEQEFFNRERKYLKMFKDQEEDIKKHLRDIMS